MSSLTLTPNKSDLRFHQRRLAFLGYWLDPMGMEETIVEVNEIIKNRQPVQHCVLNSFKIYLMERDAAFASIVRQCGFVQADGMSVVWASRLLGVGRIPRIPGVDLMDRLLIEAEKKGHRIFILGATDDVIAASTKNIMAHYPNIQMAGTHHGFFNPDEDEKVIEKIANSNSDILFVAISSPKKEIWLSKYLNQLNVPFCMGVGGSLEIYAGIKNRAPQWIQNMGCEWIYRLFQDPLRLFNRYWRANWYFMFLVLGRMLSGKSEGPS